MTAPHPDDDRCAAALGDDPVTLDSEAARQSAVGLVLLRLCAVLDEMNCDEIAAMGGRILARSYGVMPPETIDEITTLDQAIAALGPLADRLNTVTAFRDQLDDQA